MGPLYSDYKRKKPNNPAKRPAYYLAFLERDREKIHPNTAFRNAARYSLFSKRDAFPCSPSVLSSPPDPDLDRASLPPVASCLLASGLVCCGVRPAAARLSPCCARRPAAPARLPAVPACLQHEQQSPAGTAAGRQQKSPAGTAAGPAGSAAELRLPAVQPSAPCCGSLERGPQEAPARPSS